MVFKKIIISFYPQVSSYDISNTLNFAESFGGLYVQDLDIINAIVVEVPEEYAKILTDALNQAGFIKYAHESARSFVLGKSQRYNTLVNPEVTPWGINHVKARQAHSSGFTGQGVKVGILDTGIDYNHPDLVNNIAAYKNFVSNEPNNDGKDVFCHGTHVAGTIAANGRITGVAPDAKLYMARVLDSNGSGDDIGYISGAEWLINQGVKIINASLGFSQDVSSIRDMTNKMNQMGIQLIAAAGNAGSKDDSCSKDTVGYPAKYDSAIAVSAIQSDNTLAPFSSRGPKVEIAAPGRWVYSTFCRQYGPLKYKSWNGTSMAAPHTTGVAALILSAFPNISVSELRQRLDNSCYNIGNSMCFGKGVPDAYAAVTGTSPTAPPSKPTQSLTTCTSDLGCYSLPGYGPNLSPECTIGGNCFRCNDDLDPFMQCVDDPTNGTTKTLKECTDSGCSGFSRSSCLDVSGKKMCIPSTLLSCQISGKACIKTKDCKQICEGSISTKYTCSNGECIEDPNGQYNNYTSCIISCGGATLPTGTEPSITQPTGTEPSGTHPTGTGTQPKPDCPSKNITIAGRCINKYYLYGGLGAATIGGIGIYLRKKNII